MLKQLSQTTNVVAFEESIIKSWYDKIKNCEGIFKLLDAQSEEHFVNLCQNSDFLVQLADYGYARIYGLQTGFAATMHAAFWSAGMFREIEQLKKFVSNLMRHFDLHRLQIIIPKECKSLHKFIVKLGFTFEGTLFCHGKIGDKIFDENIYSMVRR